MFRTPAHAQLFRALASGPTALEQAQILHTLIEDMDMPISTVAQRSQYSIPFVHGRLLLNGLSKNVKDMVDRPLPLTTAIDLARATADRDEQEAHQLQEAAVKVIMRRGLGVVEARDYLRDRFSKPKRAKKIRKASGLKLVPLSRAA